jgi:hypothetical protein
MTIMLQRTRTARRIRKCMAMAMAWTTVMLSGEAVAGVQPVAYIQPQTAAAEEAPARIPNEQLDSLVAPIALFPDPMLAQVLAASTYPLELLQLHQWLQKNPGLEDKALMAAVEKQPWDPSIQAMAALPDLVKRLADDIQWTTDLGNAFLAQQGDVMDAVQRMRQKAQERGTLTSTPQQTVETQVIEREQIIVIEQADPEVIYVPSYNPLTVWGDPYYPYPPIYYPPPGYYGGLAVAFGAGVVRGAFWSGGWGWGAGWGDRDITVNQVNHFNQNANIRQGNRSVSGRSSWQHSAAHRGGAPYRDRATANKFGGTARGDSLTQRQAGARQQVQQQGGSLRSGAVGTTGVGDRAGSFGGRTGASVGDRDATTSFGGGGADRIGSHDLSRGDRGDRSAFGGGGSGGFDGRSARASSARGTSSISRGGGMSRGGGRRR